MKSPLIKKQSFQAMYENLVIRTQILKKKNDQYQRLSGENADEFLSQISEERKLINKEIEETKDMMEQIESKFREPHHQNKLKQAKKEYEKQIARYKSIMERYSEKQLKESDLSRRNRNSKEDFLTYNPYNEEYSSHGRQQQQEADGELEFERKMLMEKKKALSEAEQSTERINNLVTDMAGMVEEQGQNLDIIGEEMLKAHQNIEDANSELDEAQVLQKKSRKKYAILVCLIIFIMLGAVGAYFIYSR